MKNSRSRVDSYHRSSSHRTRKTSRLHSSTRQATQHCRRTHSSHFLLRRAISLSRASTRTPTHWYPTRARGRASRDPADHSHHDLIRSAQSCRRIQRTFQPRISRSMIESRLKGLNSLDPSIVIRISSARGGREVVPAGDWARVCGRL